MRLRAYLVLMSAAILIPVLGFYAAALNMLEKTEKEATFEQLHEKVNSVALLIERELSSTESALRILATSVNLNGGNLPKFYEQAKAAKRSPTTWFVLLDGNGQQLVNTHFPYGTVLPAPIHAQEKIDRLMGHGEPIVTDVLLGPGTQRLITTLAMPIKLENGKRYILLAVFSTEHFLQLIKSVDISVSWVTGIVDSKGQFVARTLDSQEAVGKTARADLLKAINSESEGVIRHQTLEGLDSYGMFKHIAHTNWSVAIAAPVELVNSTSIRAAKLASIGMGAGVLLAAILAFVFSGRIIRSIEQAKIASGQLSRGELPEFGKSGIKEINELYDALEEASAQLLLARDSKTLAEMRANEAGVLLELAVEAAELGTFHCPYPLDKIYWNNTCKRHFFLSEGTDIDFELFYERIHPDDREKIRSAVEAAVFKHEMYDAEYRTISSEGDIRWIRAKGRAYYDLNGKPVRFDGITIDISRNKEVEASLEKASRQKDDFLAMLAHELRNPLAPISSAASLLRLAGPDPARVLKTSEIISRQVSHMAALLDDLLDVSRVTRGIINLKQDVVDVKGVISAASEQVHPLMLSKQHRFLIEMPAEPLQLLGDEKRLVQVVVNLLTNAARYTQNAGDIRLSLKGETDTLSITVADNGIGLSHDLIGRVFELFVQGERTPDRHQGGLGLGLPLVKSLVELHGGKVFVTSEGQGKGSVFTVLLPRHTQQSAKAVVTTGPNILGNATSPLRIMIVDDNADVANMLGMFLEEIGHHIEVETDSRVAFTRSLTEKTDVFILDIGMPGMNGYELAEQLRRQSETQYAMLIALSGYGQESDVAASISAGFNYHLVKPVDIQKLLSLLNELN